jgi:uncharacterized protein with NRDE domain
MCLIFLSFNQHPKYPLIIAANRDEFFDRPAKPMDFWPENPNILAGKDLSGGGTWLGITKSGYFAMLTNYRDMANIKADAPTRGKLVLDYLVGEFSPPTYLQALNASASQYNGYNIILGTLEDPWYYSNQTNKLYRLGTGLYGLSNALLDTKWPKVERGKEKFHELVQQDELDFEAMINIMHDRKLAPDDLLPDTGIGYEKEKLLSSMFIEMPGYGTRNTTILVKDRDNNIMILERTYSHPDDTTSDKSFNISLTNSRV